MKLTRGAYRVYVDSTFGGTGAPSWYWIGRDIDDMETALNPDTETKKNIQDETSFSHRGYEPQVEADPFYADPSDPLYPQLRDIALGRKTGDDCKTTALEVIIDDTSESSHLAYTEDVYLVPSSIGGGTDGVNIPFTLSFAGNRQQGTVTFTNRVPTFTAASGTVVTPG